MNLSLFEKIAKKKNTFYTLLEKTNGYCNLLKN